MDGVKSKREKDRAEEDGNERRVRGWWEGAGCLGVLQRWKARLHDTIQRE